MGTLVLQAYDGAGAAEAARRGAEALRAGQLVGFATETVYGVGALATDAKALQRLRVLKDRPARPFGVHLARPRDVGQYVSDVPMLGRRLIERAWPGPITLLLNTGGRLADPRWQEAGLHDVLAREDTIGLRCPAGEAAGAMLAGAGGPVVATSANLAGAPAPRTAAQAMAQVGGRIELMLDSGPTRYGQDSTIVRLAGRADWDIVRQGVCDRKMVAELMRETVLFVCTGNTCRSPMAEGLARKMLAERFACDPRELADRALVEVLSAGVFAADGLGASAEAVLAARARGADIGDHRSRKLTTELITRADLIFCMTVGHADDVCRLCPAAAERVRRLSDRGDVPDPIGAPLATYEQVAGLIEDALKHCLKKELQ